MTQTGLTKAREQTAVGEGLAVGCLALGVDAFSSNRQFVQSSFVRAWREWPAASRFRFVHASVARNDLIPILAASAGRKGPILAAWSCSSVYEPYLTVEWDLEEVADVLFESTGVTFEGWVELARLFTDAMGQDKLRRSAN